ncbi:MAG: hypothetical protein KBG28_21135 [Kofleriaceae bacterium]|nr:hypothetical protein [Kofleriaceae bacterium]MBP6838566.1 hypothetical protein [Kofleriaceae bacterium]MBP9206491.1 hypothetical protein [Kofleriaceae bacterium]
MWHSRAHRLVVVATALALGAVLLGCGAHASPGAADASPAPVDAAAPADATVDAVPPDAAEQARPPAEVSMQLAAARAAGDGLDLDLPVDGATVTFLRPALGGDVAGFTVQAEPTGPALLVTVDPAGLSPALAVGDVVGFTITGMGGAGRQQRLATTITNLRRFGSGPVPPGWVQDVGMVSTLVADVGAYEHELVRTSATISGPFTIAGTGFEQATITTAAVPASPDLRLRLPSALGALIDLSPGCLVELGPTPLGRFSQVAQLAAFTSADVRITSCPPPHLTAASAPGPTTVRLAFDRRLDPSTVMADGGQFSADAGLAITAADLVDPRTIVLTTSAQEPGRRYQLGLAATLADEVGAPLDLASRSITVSGFAPPALVVINEVGANLAAQCDLIELRVTAGGTLDGMVVRERAAALLTLPALVVPTDTLLVVHLGAASTTCNPSGAVDELTGPAAQPSAGHPGNHDGAYDLWSTDAGLVATDNVLTIETAAGTLLDGVLLTDDPARTSAAADSEARAAVVAAAGQWTRIAGGVPAGGFVDAEFNAHAAPDLDDAGTTRAGPSIQRLDRVDRDHAGDWGHTTAASWGLLNPGQ